MRSVLCTLLVHAALTNALRLQGTYQSSQFFKFLAKYGIQQTTKTDASGTQGYIFGNVTTNDPAHNNKLTLVVVDSEYFVTYYALAKSSNRKCQEMFRNIDEIAWDGYCKPSGIEDFLRKVPCRKDALCTYETDPTNVLPGYQFTYHIQDTRGPRFWYVSIVSCDRTFPECAWSYNASTQPTFEVTYDIWLVNGSPDRSQWNPFEHHFSFEMHDVFEIYMIFAVMNLALLAASLHAYRARRHPLILLLATVIALDTLAALSNLMHTVVFSVNGVGVPALSEVAQVVSVSARCIFMLTLLFVAKGWTITFTRLGGKLILFVVWSLYSVVYMILCIWNLFVVDRVDDVDEWQTWPGYIMLAFRLIMMVWFLYELLQTYVAEDEHEKLQFYVRFGAGFLVWFIYLPIVVLIGTAVPTLWRFKALLSLQLGANFFFHVILLHLMWPGHGPKYFAIGTPAPRQGAPVMLKRLTSTVGPGAQNSELTGLIADEDDESSADELYMRQVAVNATYAADNHRIDSPRPS